MNRRQIWIDAVTAFVISVAFAALSAALGEFITRAEARAAAQYAELTNATDILIYSQSSLRSLWIILTACVVVFVVVVVVVSVQAQRSGGGGSRSADSDRGRPMFLRPLLLLALLSGAANAILAVLIAELFKTAPDTLTLVRVLFAVDKHLAIMAILTFLVVGVFASANYLFKKSEE